MKSNKTTNSGEKKKKPKNKKLIVILVVFALIAIGAIGYFFGIPIYEHFKDGGALINTPNEEPKIAKESEYIDYNSETGELYLNDEIIVLTNEGATEDDVQEIAKNHDAAIVSSMPEIGFWKLRLNNAKEYNELTKIAEKISKNRCVENAYVNTLFEVEEDVAEAENSDAFERREPVYPNDSWNGADWDMNVPRGENWGVEAVHAPAAWAYSDELSSVKVGLIDSMPDLNHEDLKDKNIHAYVIDTDIDTNEVKALKITNNDKYYADEHGTHVAGTIAGVSGNGKGVTGVANENAELYYCQAFYSRRGKEIVDYYDGYGYVAAIRQLVNQGVKSINISQNTSKLIGFSASRGNKNAINHINNQASIAAFGLKRLVALGNEFVVCVAAGNSNSTEYYPDEKEPYGYRTYTTLIEKILKRFGKYSGEKGDSEAKYNNFLNFIDNETVKSRIIVVGAVGINGDASTSTNTRFTYSYFSNIGERVDIVAPGEDVYSCVPISKDFPTGYASFPGTSMATPHVTGICGLVFAANPELSGAEVKSIVLASTYGRWNYTGGYSGMADAEQAVISALKSRDESVNRVIHSTSNGGLDICFVVDTTGSMGDDIDNAKENMVRILTEISNKTQNFRIALIDYRDFPNERGSNSTDYASRLQLPFSSNTEKITQAINSLSLGNGGDFNETVYSALMKSSGLEWKPDAVKAIIILGDAPPLDPEPHTKYTFGQVAKALYNADINIDFEESDERVLGDAKNSLIKVYSIGTDASRDAEDFFKSISELTGGEYTGVDSASKVSDAIVDSIEKIDVKPQVNVTADFGIDYSNETVELYNGNDYLFEFTLNENGMAELPAMDIECYHFSIPRLLTEGSLDVSKSDKRASISFSDGKWYQFAIVLWQRHQAAVIASGAGILAVLIVVLIIIIKIKKWLKKRKDAKALKQKSTPSKSTKAPPQNIPVSAPPKSTNAAPHELKSVYCTKCGKQNSPEAKFCRNCGTEIKR